MNQEQIRAKAIECGAMIITMDDSVMVYAGEITFSDDKELATYTAAVEARERERCAVITDEYNQAKLNTAMMISEAIRAIR